MESVISALQSILKAYTLGKSLPTGPYKITALIAIALASYVNRKDSSNLGHMESDTRALFNSFKAFLQLEWKFNWKCL